jgi:hypothetical protein
MSECDHSVAPIYHPPQTGVSQVSGELAATTTPLQATARSTPMRYSRQILGVFIFCWNFLIGQIMKNAKPAQKTLLPRGHVHLDLLTS